MMRRIVSALSAAALFTGISGGAFAADEAEYSVNIGYTENGGEYSVYGEYSATPEADDNVRALLAVYEESGALRSVTTSNMSKMTSAVIGDVPAEEGNTVKGMIWDSEELIPLAKAVVKPVNQSGADVTTPAPTDAPTATPAAEPATAAPATAAPTAAATAEPAQIAATYKFDFGADTAAADGYTAVTPDMVYDMANTDAEEGYCGFLGTTDDSYADDVLQYDCDSRAIDGFTLVKGQRIDLTSGGTNSETDADSDYIAAPVLANYVPSDASEYDGRFPIRFSMKAEEKSYYTVTATLADSSATDDANVSLYSEKRQIIAENVKIEPGETATFKFNVDIENKYYKNFSVTTFNDDMLNIAVTGENAAISSLVVEKHAKVDGTIKGEAQQVNDGVTMWLCTDSTGCDYAAKVPFFALQNYAGVGQALTKYAPENIAVSNQGEGGLATSDKVHFENCLLKEGDYLYVQYGHNESGADSYVTNLEKYYTRAHESGANLLVVSPVNRHNSSVYSDGTWTSSFSTYITAGKQFVADKIAAGATDIAYVDLNTPYVEWMNEETDRILSINSDIPRQSAMNFYYYSVKGSSVDNAHLNDAGADRGAYCFFTAARATVEAAAADGADSATITQAKVLEPLVTGMRTTVGDTGAANEPLAVSDDVIKAGAAPNSYWDTVPSDYFDYDNSAAVDSVDMTTNDDGTVTIKGVGIRGMNALTYVKAVVTVDDTRYYTESNYDFTGVDAGTLITHTGFITSDKNHADVTDSDRLSEITVPAGGKCTVEVYECDENWVVGESAALSAPFEICPETNTVFDQTGASIEGWSVLTGAASHSETVTVDGDDTYIALYSSCVDSANNKKNYGFYKELDEGMATGVYRLSFTTKFESGVARFALINKVGSASSPFSNKIYALCIDNGEIYINSAENKIYTATADDGTRSNKINANQWVNVDAIVNINEGTLSVSAAGCDYTTIAVPEWQVNDGSQLPINYFGIAGSSDGTPMTIDIKNMKVTELKSDAVTRSVSAAVNDDAYGTASVSSDTVELGASVTFTAASSDGYRFLNWTDESGNEVSTSAEYTISRVYADTTLTANFEAIPENMTEWNFSDYADSPIDTTTATTDVTYTKSDETLDIHLGVGDSITTSGIYWATPGSTKSDTTVVSNNRYIKYTPTESGTLTVSFQGSAYASSSKCPRLYVTQGDDESCMYKTNTHVTQKDATAANATATLEAALEKGVTYYIWAYYYNNTKVNFTVSDVTFTSSEN